MGCAGDNIRWLARSGPHPNTKAGTKEAFNEACLRAVVSLTVQSRDRTLNEQEKRQVLDTIENQDGQVGTEGNFSVDAIRHKDDEVFIDGALCVTLRKAKQWSMHLGIDFRRSQSPVNL